MGIPVVEEFLEAFADDLPRLPHVRKIEFAIDLEPIATPVYKELIERHH